MRNPPDEGLVAFDADSHVYEPYDCFSRHLEAEFAHVLFGGAAHTGDQFTMDISDDDQDYLGLPGLLDASTTAALLKKRESDLRKSMRTRPESELTPGQQQAAHKMAAELRKEVASLVNRVAARTSRPHASVHSQVRKKVPGPPSKAATVEQLEARRDYLLTLI